MKDYCLCFILSCIVFSGCKSQQPSDRAGTDSIKSIPKSYTALSENYSNKLLLTAINSIYKKTKLNVNNSDFYFPNIYEIDSLNSETKIKDKVLVFLNSNDSSQVTKKIKNWCDSYLLLDEFLSVNNSIYFEELVLKEKRFTTINHYFSNKEQDINSLSLSQSQMLYLDFVNFLSEFKINERVIILNNAIKSKNW